MALFGKWLGTYIHSFSVCTVEHLDWLIVGVPVYAGSNYGSQSPDTPQSMLVNRLDLAGGSVASSPACHGRATLSSSGHCAAAGAEQLCFFFCRVQG